MDSRVIALTDVMGYSSPIRTHNDRTRIRNNLNRMLRLAFGSDQDVWYEGRGDGMLIVFPPQTDFVTICREFEFTIARHLHGYNAICVSSASLSIRVALEYGPVEMDDMGYNGDCMIRAGRMIESKIFKQAIAASRASVGIIMPTTLSVSSGVNFSNFRTQVKGMSLLAGMRMV